MPEYLRVASRVKPLSTYICKSNGSKRTIHSGPHHTTVLSVVCKSRPYRWIDIRGKEGSCQWAIPTVSDSHSMGVWSDMRKMYSDTAVL